MKDHNIQIVLIDDDPEMETRPLYEELLEKYDKENVIWKEKSIDGIDYVSEHLDKRTIIILDYDFGSKNDNGLVLFRNLQDKSSLLYIILNTAKSIDEIPNDELKMFINNHLMALVDKTDGYKKTLYEVDKAVGYLNSSVDCILEEWILRHKLFTNEDPFIKDEKGNPISLSDVLSEIRKNTDFGREMTSNIISTAISLIQKDINKIDES